MKNIYREVNPKEIHFTESHKLLLSGVSPRPIAFVGTQDSFGNDNLAPFSFFNAFGANPPTIAISPALRGTDGKKKDTLLNILELKEFTVSNVSFNMVEQMSLASTDYSKGTDEFVKSGFSKLESTIIKPFGVLEAPMVMECILKQHLELGGLPGSGNLLIGEVVMFHVKEDMFTGKYLDYSKLDLVARMGGANYSRANFDSVFTLEQPNTQGIGFDNLPEFISKSKNFSKNELAKLASVTALPSNNEVMNFWQDVRKYNNIVSKELLIALNEIDNKNIVDVDNLIQISKHFIHSDVIKAWMILLSIDN